MAATVKLRSCWFQEEVKVIFGVRISYQQQYDNCQNRHWYRNFSIRLHLFVHLTSNRLCGGNRRVRNKR